MKLEITVSEVKEIIKSLDEQPEQLFEMIRSDIRESVAAYLDALMQAELTAALGRERYQRVGAAGNYRNGSYPRRFTIKGVAMFESWSHVIAGASIRRRSCPVIGATSTRSAAT